MIVFAGPSVDAALRALHTEIDWRPPAVAGDLLQLRGSGTDKVLLIDGLFDEQASVKHKEAVALMAEGTRLYGASSMGALRAAELQPFGMVPLGRIADAYCRGQLTGDDEVALVHGNERMDWKAASVPMVEARATLCRALRTQKIGPRQARALRECWHDIHFVDRDWPTMIEAAGSIVARKKANELAALHVPLKRQDAELAVVAALDDQSPAQTRPELQRTVFLDRLKEGLNRC